MTTYVGDGKNYILLLPLEIRQQIYGLCFDGERPQPGILQVNRRIYDEAAQFIRRRSHTFSYEISARGAGFSDSARWRFKIKRHRPRLSRMKRIIIRIEPPRLDTPFDMWYIWHHVRDFCKELAAYKTIPALTINFLETESATWETNGVPHSTWYVGDIGGKQLRDWNIGQILVTFGYLLNNVDKATLSIPGSFMHHYRDVDGELCVKRIKECMMGVCEDDEYLVLDHEILEDKIEDALPQIQRATGRKSMDAFRRSFGSTAMFSTQDLHQLEQRYPCMNANYFATDHPRYRAACEYGCQCGYDYIEVSMPDPTWTLNDLDRAEEWQEEEIVPLVGEYHRVGGIDDDSLGGLVMTHDYSE